MRVRPFFWYLLALSCMSVLIFAASVHEHAPAIMQVHVREQPPITNELTTLELSLTDTQGLPIEQAQVVPRAWMTNMEMPAKYIRVEPLGKGNYLAKLRLYMAGPWEISVEAHADGFDSLVQTLLVHVK